MRVVVMVVAAFLWGADSAHAQLLDLGFAEQFWGYEQVDHRLTGALLRVRVGPLDLQVEAGAASWRSSVRICGGAFDFERPLSCWDEPVERHTATLGIGVGIVLWRPALPHGHLELAPTAGLGVLRYDVDEAPDYEFQFGGRSDFADYRVLAMAGGVARFVGAGLWDGRVQPFVEYALSYGATVHGPDAEDRPFADLLSGASRRQRLAAGLRIPR